MTPADIASTGGLDGRRRPWSVPGMSFEGDENVLDLLIQRGQVILETGESRVDIGVKDGKIVQLGRSEYMADATSVIDAGDMLVLPGMIDPHTHFSLPLMGTTTGLSFQSGTRAACMGGTTTVIDFAIQPPGTLLGDTLAERRQQADGKVAIDYALHLVVTDATRPVLSELRDVVADGVPSLMMNLKRGTMNDDVFVAAILEQIRDRALWTTHAVDSPISDHLVKEAVRRGHTEPIYHALTKPPLVEAEALNRALFMTEHTGAALYDFHMSIAEGVERIGRARDRGRPVYAETCTHYLALTEDALKREDGINFICSPPLRSREHVDALWNGLRDGVISTLGSDECTFTHDQKLMGKGSFADVPNGLCGMEFRLPIMYTEGVLKGRISLSRMVEVLSTNAARIFGLYPRKGVIAVGSDADLVLFDPRKEATLSVEDSATGCDWHPYEGMVARGWPINTTIARGRVSCVDGTFRGDAGHGSFLKRRIAQDVLEGPVV